jgi:putative FmdB family regulatory protein
MPIYEYQCRECSHRLEKIQKMSDAPLTRCPECGKDALTKLVSAAGFRLKGGGWYETDFKKDGKRNLAGDGGASKSSEGGSSDSGSKNGTKEGGKEGGKKDSAQPSSQSSGKSSDSSAKSGKSDKSSRSSSTPSSSA